MAETRLAAAMEDIAANEKRLAGEEPEIEDKPEELKLSEVRANFFANEDKDEDD